MNTTRIVAIAVSACALGLAAPAGAADPRLPRGSEPVDLDPAHFTTKIDNPYFPLRPGDRRVYRKLDLDGSRIRVVETVTDRTKVIANGVRARVVHVVDTERGEMIEETFDWYAQDRAGNVWYLGEDTTFFENGMPVLRPDSWQAGVDGAYPGVVMPGRPRVGLRYRQESYKDVAQDRARILARGVQAEVPGRHFKRTLLVGESTPLEPKVLDLFFFAHGVGLVLAVEVSGGTERLELVRFERR
jgi:hypothetical protein